MNMNNHRPRTLIRQPRCGVTAGRTGFTLVEMMVSIALVMLMMLMFAQIFEQAAGSVATQRGMAKNDQNARTLTTLMRQDLRNRTFRDVVPYYPGQNTNKGGALFAPGRRKGYFSISENVAGNDLDDVLALTTDVSAGKNLGSNESLRPYAGKATLLDPLSISSGQNQPEFDDGDPTNGSGSSRFAEITYFVRNGNLYRRILLIREPYDLHDGSALEESATPGELPVNYLSEDANNNGQFDSGEDNDNNGSFAAGPPFNETFNTIFWRDFDYSAYRVYLDNPGVRFHDSSEALNNINPVTNTIPLTDTDNDGITDIFIPPSLGIPHLRFGHSMNRIGTINGTPREYVNNGNRFIGRFTTQETAHRNFQYPGVGASNVDPHTRNDLTLVTNQSLIEYGSVTQYVDLVAPKQTFRRGEEILLSNVHEFDIKVWDDYEEKDLDGDGTVDPFEDFNGDGDFANDRLMQFVDLGHTSRDTIHNNGNGSGEFIGFYNNNELKNSAVTAPNVFSLGRQPNSVYGNRYDTWHPYDDDQDPTTAPPQGYPAYCPLIGPRTPVTPITNFGLGNNIIPEIPLKAIQITIRYYDPTSDQVRQLTLVHSLVD